MSKITDYIVSLTHLYGLVHKDDVEELIPDLFREIIKNLARS